MRRTGFKFCKGRKEKSVAYREKIKGEGKEVGVGGLESDLGLGL